MKIWNRNICLTSPVTIMIMIALLFSTLVLAGVFNEPEIIVEIKETESPNTTEEIWIPTKEDIAYQDSMYCIIQNTQSDVDTIKEHIEYILDRLDYPDGTHDSIRVRR